MRLGNKSTAYREKKVMMYTFTVDWMINCTPRTPESFLYYEKLVNYKREGQILHARCDN
jgi:hypothetical protein